MKNNRMTVLPVSVKKSVEKADLNALEKSRCYDFLDTVMNYSKKNHKNLFSYVNISRTHLRKLYTGKYKNIVRTLENMGAVDINHSYAVKRYTKSYKIGKIIKNSFEKEDRLCNVFYRKEKEDTSENIYLERFKEDFKKLKIDYKKLENVAFQNIRKVDISDYIVDEEIEDKKLCVIFNPDTGRKYFFNDRTSALENIRSKEGNMSLIQDGHKYYAMHVQNFLKMKKSNIYLSAISQIRNLQKGFLYARRNATNGRLDTNFTNMHSFLVEEIIRQNGLVQFDLSNSQFCILSNLLKYKLHNQDVKDFYDAATSGQLYEKMQEQLDVKKRKDAKKLAFLLMFSKADSDYQYKDKMKETYPNLFHLIDDYKRINGDNSFPIWLQREESKLFIDNIYEQIKGFDLLCFTKHDSVIVDKNYADMIYKLIQDEFESVNFKGVIC